VPAVDGAQGTVPNQCEPLQFTKRSDLRGKELHLRLTVDGGTSSSPFTKFRAFPIAIRVVAAVVSTPLLWRKFCATAFTAV
jgi:hypothetical protein